ncbi:MAG: Methionyl-tRNA formyltransferase [Burkholderiaceae bacterium]|jgi:methionyl-tRNA formyltransferase|nr:MAG: Methionyl-tRNA formyltransferase [Burkholderiaceae bacterium]
MRIIFAGTPEFARVALRGLLGAGHEVALVLTQPDRPAGRGLQTLPSPVKRLALEQGLSVIQPRSLRLDGKHSQDAAAARAAIAAAVSIAGARAMVVAAYGLILPQWVLDAMDGAVQARPGGAESTGRADATGGPAQRSFGCLNIHASLLPRWRGAAPIQRAIEAGDAETGVTIMQMDAGLDTGAMLLAASTPIAPQDSAATLHDRLAPLGGRLIVDALAALEAGRLVPTPQPAAGASYAHKIDKMEAAIDWSLPAAQIERRIRAFDPAPGASARLGDTTLKVWRSEIDSELLAPDMGVGMILSANAGGVRVVCGDGVLLLTELQRPGGRRLPAGEFLRGFALHPGQRFER